MSFRRRVWPWRITRADRLELLEQIAARAIRVSYQLVTGFETIAEDDKDLWDLHDLASQYEVYEHQRAKGFPHRGGGLPRYPTYAELCDAWDRNAAAHEKGR